MLEQEALAEAHELGDRFPDKDDEEVIEHIEFVFKTKLYNLDLREAVIIAYEGDLDAASRYLRAMRV